MVGRFLSSALQFHFTSPNIHQGKVTSRRQQSEWTRCNVNGTVTGCRTGWCLLPPYKQENIALRDDPQPTSSRADRCSRRGKWKPSPADLVSEPRGGGDQGCEFMGQDKHGLKTVHFLARGASKIKNKNKISWACKYLFWFNPFLTRW